MLSPPSAKKLSSMPTRCSPSTSANSAHRISSCGVRGARTAAAASDPAPAAPCGRACRSASAAARRAPQTPTAPCSPAGCSPRCARSAAASTLPIGGRHHIGHQPLAARARPRAQSPPPAPPRHAAAAPPRSRQARCGSRASSPAGRRAPGSPEPRPPASAPDPRCGTSGSPAGTKRVGHKPLRRQSGTPQIAARQPRPRNVKLARNPDRNRLKPTVQNINPRVPDRPANRRTRRRRPSASSP